MAEFASKGVAGSGLGLGIDGTIANMMGTIGKITDTVVPISAVCPTPMAKHKLLEAIEKRNKESYHTEGVIRAYKDALKALYYLISIEKSGGVK